MSNYRTNTHIFNFALTAAMLLGASGCVEDAALNYGDLNLDIEVQPVAGQGLQIEAYLHNQEAPVSASGFRVINTAPEDLAWQIRGYEPIDMDLKQSGAASFSTLAVPNAEWMNVFTGYAYVVVGGREFRSEEFTYELERSEVPRTVPEVDRVECLSTLCDYRSIHGKLRLHGRNFCAYEPGYTDSQLWLELLDSPEISFEGYRVTDTQVEVNYKAKAFKSFPLTLRQGGVDYRLSDSLYVLAPDTLIAPKCAMREGEFFNLHHGSTGYYEDVDSLKLTADSPHAQWRSCYYNLTTDFGFLPDVGVTTASFHQFIHGYSTPNVLHVEFSSPWHEVARPGSLPRPESYEVAGGRMWYLSDDLQLHGCDPLTGQITDIALPSEIGTNCRVVIGHSDEEHLMLAYQSPSSTRVVVFRFSLADQSFTSIGGFGPKHFSEHYISFVGESDDFVCVGFGNTWSTDFCSLVMCGTKEGMLDRVIKEEGTIVKPNQRFVCIYGSRVYMLNGWYNTLEYIDINDWHLFQRVECTAPINFTCGWEYETDHALISGHYLYMGHSPMVRYDLSNTDMPIEYLGCAPGAYSHSFLIPDGESALSIDTQTGYLYRFEQDR